MPTPRETILTTLHARLQTLPATALRGEVLPERILAAGLIILRDDNLPVTDVLVIAARTACKKPTSSFTARARSLDEARAKAQGVGIPIC